MEPKTELQKNAIAKARRIELDMFQRALDIQWLNNRMEDGRMGRCLALIRREADMEKDFQERTDHAAIVNARAAKETKLAAEIAQVHREETCELLRRHYLRERDPSLKKLQQKLQAGYVCRDLRLQIRNNEYKRLQNKAEDRHADEVLGNSLFNNLEALKHEEQIKEENANKYKRELQQQLVGRERVRQCIFEDSLIEKKMLEDIMRTLADEDQRELAQKREITKRLCNEMVTFQAARKAWKDKQKEMVIREEREIEKQKAAAADRSAAVIEERQRKMQEREDNNQRIAAKILADAAARRERDDIIKLLQEQEYLEKNINDDVGAKEKLERVKSETKNALTEQMAIKKKQARDNVEREIAFRKETEAKLIADKQRDVDELARKREKGRLYSAELLVQVAQDKERKLREKQEEEQRAQYVFAWDKAWREEVAKEREKIIEEHAPPLLGHVARGVLQPADLPAVRAGAARVERLAPARRAAAHDKCNAQCRELREY